MLRFFNRCGWWLLWLGLAIAPAQRASAFAFWGTPESFQTLTLGYVHYYQLTWPDGQVTWFTQPDDFAWHPRNLGEEFRWNNPVLYYTYDQSFLDYFGSNGVAAVDAAVGILNGLSKVSSYSADLSEFPLEEVGINYTASALHLFDLKSAALELLVERLALADPERWTWCLRAKLLPTGAGCPHYDFSVIQRNWDPVTWEPSRYVNGTLFTFEIEQVCPPDPRGDIGDAVEFPVDLNGDRYTAVATPKITLPDVQFYGYFHTGLTRDDVGGLRYLYATNNMNTEAAGAGTVTSALDLTTTNLLVTSNLTLFAAQALTNDAPTLMGLYPGLVDLGTTPIFTNLVTTNVSIAYTNNPLAPYGTPPQPYLVTNLTTTVATWYRHYLANVVTNSFSTRALVTVYSTNITFNPLAPYGTPPQTNVSTVLMWTNMIMGDFYIQTNCGVHIVKTQLTSYVPFTNTFPSTNNLPVITNTFPASSGAIVYYFTNHIFQVNPINCVTNSVALRQGIEKVTFVRRDYDSLLGQYWAPITNYYTLTAVTNNSLVPQTIWRVVTQPDILFSAADLATAFPIPTVFRSGPTFEQAGVTNLSGPGNIRGPVNFQFNKVGPIYIAGTWPFFSDEAGADLVFTWASFDGTTNAPVIYPSSASIADLENQVLIQISPPYLPDGTVGVAYSALLQTKGATPNWQAPFTWSLAPGSAGLPPGLTLSATGGISGTPVQAGFFNFVVQATDAAGRISQQSYAINVAPHP